jgi:hypothetical protein
MTHSAAASVPGEITLPSLCAARRALAREISAPAAGLRKAIRRSARGGAFLRPIQACPREGGDRTVEDACVCGGGESGQQVERLAFRIEPSCSFPASAHDDISALFAHTSQPLGMHESPIGNENISFGDRHAVELLAPLLVGQCKKAEPFGGKVEGTMNPPQAIVLLRGSARFWDRRAVDKANAPAMCRQLATEQLADQMFEPGLAIAQAFQQRHPRLREDRHWKGPQAGRTPPRRSSSGAPSRPGNKPGQAEADRRRFSPPADEGRRPSGGRRPRLRPARQAGSMSPAKVH